MTSSDKRKWPRYPTEWRAHVAKRGEKGGTYRVVNASEGGLFLAMEDPPEVSTWLIVEVDDGNASPVVAGEVAHRKIEAAGATLNGVGVELLLKPEAWGKIVEGLAGT